MKKALLFTALLAAGSATTTYASSKPAEKNVNLQEARRAGLVIAPAITGAIVGGPVGMFAGFLSGIWVDHKVSEAGQAETLAVDLADAEEKIETLSNQLTNVEQNTERYAQMALQQVELEMLFKTGQSEVSAADKQRLAMLGDYMNNNPQLQIRLDGYADPRGDANYNLTLSKQRVQSVMNQLLTMGVDSSRISQFSHGDSRSQAQPGNYDEYALERMVRVQLLNQQEDLAQLGSSR